MKYLPTVLVWLIMGTIATAFRLHSLTRAYRMVLEASGNFATHYQELTVPTGRGISLIDVTKGKMCYFSIDNVYSCDG